MKTRSQTALENQQQKVDINFDEASKYWLANKKKLSNGCYTYVCGALLKNGKFCKRNIKNNGRCTTHSNRNKLLSFYH